jgi:amidophosphoribosyltransferase
VYGIDMPSASEFIANGRSIEEINTVIGSDRLFYQTLEDLEKATLLGTGKDISFDSSCFDGNYVTGDITDEYLRLLQEKRNDSAKQDDSDEDQILDLHNDST